MLGCLFWLAVAALVAAGVGAAFLYQKYSQGLPSVAGLENYKPAETTRILSSDGKVIATLFKENRVYQPLDKISPHVVKALLAIEDSRFYDHPGVDPVGVVRAVYVATTSGQVREGASTITMQLARNLFLNNDATAERKIREMLLALRLEKEYDKNKILELYLNQVYFGAGAYGIHSASRLYFNKGCENLTPAQAALLVGLLQAPSSFSPLVDAKAARARQGQVLNRMLGLGFLTKEQYDRAVDQADAMTFKEVEQRRFEVLKYPYFTSYVIKELSERYPEDTLYRGGLEITTTLDRELQGRAEEILEARVHELANVLNVDNGALVMVENENGYIRAMVGGVQWSEKDQFNRAWQARRQPGSSFKAVVYSTALEEGYTPDSIVDDSKTSYNDGWGKDWTPKNSDGRFLGRITLRQALTGSRNVPAVKVCSQVGVDRVVSMAYRMGIRGKISPSLSIALGAVEATPLEMVEVFSILANSGVDRRPTAVKLVKAPNGVVLEDNRNRLGDNVMNYNSARGMISMLRGVVDQGTGTNARVYGHAIAGKTGTTDSYRDAWFCGFSAYYTLAVWVGNDDNTPMWRSYGGDLPATIFREVMTYALRDKKPRDFPAYEAPRKKSKDVSPQIEVTPTPTVEEQPEEIPEEPVEESFEEPPPPQEVDLEDPRWTEPEAVPEPTPGVIENSPSEGNDWFTE